jgi:hypothetical protein
MTPPSPLPVELPLGLLSPVILPGLFDARAVFCENSIVSANSFLIFSAYKFSALEYFNAITYSLVVSLILLSL